MPGMAISDAYTKAGTAIMVANIKENISSLLFILIHI
jgi:hypothetical protein